MINGLIFICTGAYRLGRWYQQGWALMAWSGRVAVLVVSDSEMGKELREESEIGYEIGR